MGSDNGVLLAAGKSSGASNVKQQIIRGAPAMDSDISKVRILHVSESWSYFPVGTDKIRKEIESVVSICLWKSKMAWDVSEKLFSLDVVLIYTFGLMVILIVFE